MTEPPAVFMHPFGGTGDEVQAIEFDYVRCRDRDAATVAGHPVVVVGAGPVGLTLAIDLAQRGQPVVLLDNDCRLSSGSRAICFAKRTLEIWDRVGLGQRMTDKGVSWHVGKVFAGDLQVYQFDLLPEAGHQRPAFINLQQYYAESFLCERALALPLIDLRWKSKVVALEQDDAAATLSIETPDGNYAIRAAHVIACDGSRSTVRQLVGQESRGRTFRDRFLIADITMDADFPTERWFWFDPPFHRNQSVLLHRQPDNVWRVDFQLGWDADPEVEKRPENIEPRLRALLGPEAKFDIRWASVYTFSCLRMDSFRYGRVLFAGDAAHGVSPFGARGANSGVQDVDNLGWKLDLVLRGQASEALLQSYCAEREFAADENILNSTRSTDFITPKSEISRLFRDVTLRLARHHAFARRLVNSGRLSVPSVLRDSPLNTPDADDFTGPMVPGAPAADAPLARGDNKSWLLRELGAGFTLLSFGDAPDWATALGLDVVSIGPRGFTDTQGLAAERYDGRPGTAYLLRPDQHVCARWRRPDAAAVRAALDKACART